MSDIKTQEIIQLLQQLLGTQQTVTIPRLLVNVFGGLQEGAFIQQLFYWTSRTGDSEGWIHKTHEDWYSECFVSPYNITKVVNAYEFISVKRIKSPFYQYKSINIYKLDTEAFLTFLIEKVKADADGLSEDTEEDIQEADAEQPDTPEENDGLFISENEKFNIGKSEISHSIENEIFDILNINDYTITIKDTADADGLSEDTEEDIQEADTEQPDKPSGNPFFDSHERLENGWDTVKPAYEKVISLVAEAYGMEEEDSLVKVLSCVFTKEARYIKKGSEWADCTLSEALTFEEIQAMLKDWKKQFSDKMPSKPMTVQSNVSKWKNSKKGASGASGTESKLKPSAIPEDF